MRHAFLIIAHDNPEILYAQLEALDSENNDFYYHLDKRMNINKMDLERYAKKSKIYYVNPQKIYWGHYSQVECELRLLETALNNRTKYDYYHLLSGVDMPLKSCQDIHAFFKKNNGKEYIHFDEKTVDENIRERISMYHLFPGRENWQRRLNGIFIKIQKFMKIDRLKKLQWKVQKGANWFSITDTLAQDIIKNKDKIKKQFRYSFCGDEVFLQTYVFNSEYCSKLYSDKFDNDYHACMRLIDWKRGSPYIFGMDDWKELIECDYIFARKFDYIQKPEIVDKLKEYLKQ